MYLFFDTETTGLPLSWNAPISDLNNWPRMVQIAWTKHNEDGKQITKKEYIIKPEGFFIPHEAAKVHGISTETANEKGISLESALNEFLNDLEDVEYLVAHNIDFDEKIVGAELIRKNLPNKIPNIKKICTMKSSIDFCQIPGKDKYKYPKLQELHFKLFNKNFENAHDALVDVKACSKCFFELKKIGVINTNKKEELEKLTPSQGTLNI